MIFTSDITVKLIQSCGSDAMIAAAAWVSTSAETGLQRATEKPEDVKGIIRYLMHNKHGTPFEHSFATFYVHAPIFVWREWHRHRIGFSYNEESARYKTLEPVFYIPPVDRPMFKIDNWKPGKPKFSTIDTGESGCPNKTKYELLCRNLKCSYIEAYEAYIDNLEMGFDPGLARDCLPVGIYSSCWVSCNPRSLMAFLSLRTHHKTAKHVSYPLYEIEKAAGKCEQIFAEQWPLTYAAFNEFGRTGP